MKFFAYFSYNGTRFEYNCAVDNLVRNYDDESYAYWLERIPKTRCGLFEINIIKNDDSLSLMEEGYVAIYLSHEQVAPECIVDAQIEFR